MEIRKHYDVIIIGGGITGTGTARDCAMRGLRTLLVERYDMTNGATGRNHGLLHSGARYAVTDQDSAAECIRENLILERIASHCVEKTDGLFITLPEDDLSFQPTFIDACLRAGIQAEAIDPKEAIRLEPAVNKELIGAVKVPDKAVDPFRLTTANVLDARLHGADILTYHEVTSFIKDGNRVVGVRLLNRLTKEISSAYASMTVNAGGIWGHHIAAMAGATINMFPAKGSLLIFGHRVNHLVLNRCRKPADADILVPGDTICIIGTTSSRVPYDEIDHMQVTPDEVNLLMREGQKLAPSLAHTRILRAYAGVRPLVAADNDPSGRSISRGIVLLDHETRDDVAGFATITGGKLTDYRLMAEWATNLVCQKVGNNKPCQTADVCLPGSEKTEEEQNGNIFAMPRPVLGQRAAKGRHGSMSKNIISKTENDSSLVCECEEVSVGEVNYAINELHVHNLQNLRRRTRVGMGTCQGELCACRAAGLLAKANGCADNTKKDLADFVNERWHGMYPIAWNDTLCEAQFISWIYEGISGLDEYVNKE